MDNQLQSEHFLLLVNSHRRDRQRTPLLSALPFVYTEDCSEEAFDIIENKEGGTIIRPQGTVDAHYFNSPQEPLRNMGLPEIGVITNSWWHLDYLGDVPSLKIFL